MAQAERELGESKWDTARGTIAGVFLAFLLLGLNFGLANLETLDWRVLSISICIGGVIGFFFGKTKDEKHFVRVRNRAFEIDSYK